MSQRIFRLRTTFILFSIGLLQTLALNLNTAEMKIPSHGKTLCTKQLQNAIDRIGKSGGGRLTVESGEYLTGTLVMRSGVELYLEEGAVLKGSTDPRHYITASASGVGKTPDIDNGSALLYANHVHGIK